MTAKKTFKIIGMHCTSCAFSIDMELEDTEGIVESNTNYARGETEVKFDSEKIDDKEIIAVIKAVGYTASAD